MAIDLKKFVRDDKCTLSEYIFADQVACKLYDHMNTPMIQEKLKFANRPKSSSAVVQNTFKGFLKQLGFKSECKGLFENYPNNALRPDYYLPLGQSGILLEVERGKTTINNMDLLDFWKCHLCDNANYLFLMVPRELRQNDQMSPRKEFKTVSKRMAAFFEPRSYTNVFGLWLFGY